MQNVLCINICRESHWDFHSATSPVSIELIDVFFIVLWGQKHLF